ncbi:MAG: outer membrane beta-barrel protein [Aquimonas sp.]|nr:outer membrane beta-barrel protein [Aquimonas sp.]
MTLPRWSRHLRLPLGLSLLLALPCVLAQEAPAELSPLRLDYRLGLLAEHSDNIRRTADDRISDTVLAPNIAFTLGAESERLSLAAAGDAEWRTYTGDSFGNELRTRLGLRGNWRILPERLSWAFEDYLGRQPIDAFAIDRPDNQQRTNVFITGPTLALRPSATTRLLAELRYIESWAQRTEEFNSQRYTLALRGLRQQSPTASVSANLEYSDAAFDLETVANQPFRRADAYVRFDRRGARLDGSLDIGGSRVDFDGGDDASQALLRIRLGHQFSEMTRLELRAERQFSDAVADLVFAAPRIEDFDLGIGLPVLRGSFVSADVYRDTSFGAALTRRTPTLTLRGDAYWREQSFLRADGLDQDGQGLRFALARPLRPTVSLGAFAGIDRRRFEGIDRRDTERLYGVQLSWQWLRNLQLDFGASRAERSSSEPGVGYDDNRVFLALLYRRG